MSIGKSEIHILGGGPAGLSAAWFAHQAGHAFQLYETSNRWGGNAITFEQGAFRYDSGAHRFHDKDPEITEALKALMGDQLQKIDAPSQIYRKGKFIDFPLTPLNLLKSLGLGNAIGAGFDLMAARLFRGMGTGSFEDHAIRTYGRGIAKSFLLDYSQKLWGLPPHQLSPAISGKRLKGLNLRTFLIEALFGKSAKTTHIDGAFYYPREGIGQIFETLALTIGDQSLNSEAKITQLFHDGNSIQTVEINGHSTFPAGQILSSLPLTLHFHLLNPAPPQALIDLAKSIRFRDLQLVALFVDTPHITPNASLYFPEPHFEFTRVVESKNRSRALAPENQTVLVAEIPCFREDPVCQLSETALIERFKNQLVSTGLISPEQVIGGKVHLMRNAYPVLEQDYQAKILPLLSYLNSFKNLDLIGRNAEFAYTHIHDLLRSGKDLIARL